MQKHFFLFLCFSLLILAREELYPTKSCPAFNNMKHTKNSHQVVLDTTKKYIVLDHHKRQNLILIKGEQPAQRWVDESCFLPVSDTDVASISKRVPIADYHIGTSLKNTDSMKHTKKYEEGKVSQQNLLALSWHNAFCETHRYKKECKRDVTSLLRSKQKEKYFILHGFWPQPRDRVYCNVERKYITMDKYKHWHKLPDLELSSETKAKLTKIMPGVHSDLHKHEWFKHGTCYGTDAEEYYKETISLVEQIYHSKVSDFFEKNMGKRVTLKQIREQFDHSFGLGAGQKVELRCKNGLITELWLHLGGGSDNLKILLQKGQKIRSRCQRGLIDKAGYGR
jgi:ribonuclease T2